MKNECSHREVSFFNIVPKTFEISQVQNSLTTPEKLRKPVQQSYISSQPLRKGELIEPKHIFLLY